MSPPTLSANERRALRARAHPLHTVVIVGSKGLTEPVLREIEGALRSHELIKVKLASDDREERTTHFATLVATLAAAPVQQIGKIAVLYREKIETPDAPPAARPKSATARRSAPSRARATKRPPTAAGIGSRARSRGSATARPGRASPKPRPTRKPGARA
jgi:putative YhbY family RNA-binding protein